MATSQQAEVLPVVLTGQDSTAAMWASFRKSAGDTKSAVDTLKKSMADVGGGSALSGLQSAASAVRLLANPYVAAAVAVGLLGKEAYDTYEKLTRLGLAAEDLGVSANRIDALQKSLAKVGGEAGVSVEALKNLRTVLDKTSRDGGYLEDLFKLNGNSLTDTAGKLRPIEDVYRDLNNMIRNGANETERLEIATNGYGSTAGPLMVKVINQAADNLDRIAKTDLDPLIRDSEEVARIWQKMSAGDSSSWLDRIKQKALDAGNSYIKMGAAALGSKAVLETMFLEDNPNAYRLKENQNYFDRLYSDVRGRSGATTTPSGRKDGDSFAQNEFDRAVNSIGKHISLMEADATAVGKTAGEHEQLRVKAQLLDAAQRAGIQVTGDQARKFDDLAARAKSAGDALAIARLQNDLFFENQQLGRSALEQTVSARLRGASVDPNSAASEMLAQQIRLNETIKETQDISKDALKGFISDLRSGVGAGQAFANMLDKIGQKLTDKAIDTAMNALIGKGLSGLGGFFGVGGASAGNLTGQDAALNSQLFPGFGTGHSGAVIGKSVTGYKHIHPAYFDNAPRYHTGGRLGPREVPFIGLEGEEVGFPNQLKAKYGRGSGRVPQFNVTVNNYGDKEATMTQEQNSSGGIDFNVTIGNAAAKEMGKPGSMLRRATDQRKVLAKR